jgi:murein DD-endopeptidase MepM/ murein hydrolase activator NlpD
METIPRSPLAAPLFTLRGDYLHLLFHLNFHNQTGQPLRLRRLQLTSLRGDVALMRQVMTEDLLASRLSPVPWIVMRDRQTIAAAHRWSGALNRVKGDTLVPARGGVSLSHQFLLTRTAGMPDRILCRVTHDRGTTEHSFRVRQYRQKTTLRLPVQGRWWVMAGHRFDEYHGQALMNSQNFAYDLGRLGPEQTTYRGVRRANESYHCHDQPVVAAADGEVVEVHDGVKENDPVGALPAFDDILKQPRLLAGNFVVLRHRGDEHTVYMHLRPGAAVRVGQKLRAGQELGRCGNSGNSSEPHLHFQLQDGPDPLRASGLPARFSDFTLHMARLVLHVPLAKAWPLPTWLTVEPGKASGAVAIGRWVRQ